MATPTILVPVPTPSPQPPKPAQVPPLESGDHLTRAEFERRYEAMPHLKKAELIEGVVYMPSPIRAEQHGEPHADLMCWLGVYRLGTPGARVFDNSTVRLDLGNEPQPDAVMIVDPLLGGRVQIDSDGYLAGGPELAIEISASSVSLDLNAKLRVYRRNGVQEYLVWRVLDHQVDWFRLRGSEYEPLPLDAEGILRSEVFPGLWLDTAALLRGDLVRVHHVLHQGLASSDHAALVAHLHARQQGEPSA